MDPITHGALGAACAQAGLLNKERQAWIIGGLAAMAPDLDIFIRSSQDPLLFLIYHRHFTHALFFIPFGAALVTLFLLVFKHFRSNWKLTFLAALIGYGTHCMLDAITSYGTLLLWPLSNQRFEWDLVAIVDPFVTVPLILGLTWTVVFKQRKGVITGLSLVLLFLGYNTIQHQRALQIAEKYAQQKGWTIRKLRALPSLETSRIWRIVIVIKGDKVIIADAYTPLLNESFLKPIIQLPGYDSQKVPPYILQNQQLKRDRDVFVWFANNYVIVLCEQPYTLLDARYTVGNKPATGLWGIKFEPSQKHAQFLRYISLKSMCQTR